MPLGIPSRSMSLCMYCAEADVYASHWATIACPASSASSSVPSITKAALKPELVP